MEQKNTFTLPNGKTIVFADLMAWDFSQVEETLGCPIEKAPGIQSSLCFAWKAATRGGYDGTFQQFCEEIPMKSMTGMIEVAKVFFSMGEDSEQEDSSNSSSTESPEEI